MKSSLKGWYSISPQKLPFSITDSSKKRELATNEFTYHKNNGTPTLFGGFILIIGIETAAFHFLLSRWSLIFAWILTSLSIYTAIQVFGFPRSLSKRPISRTTDSLLLEYGIKN